MTLLEPPVETSNKSRPLKFVAGALVVLAAVALYFAFRYYPEQRALESGAQLPFAGLFDGLGAVRILRAGEELQNHQDKHARGLQEQRGRGNRGQSVFPDAGSNGCGEEPQDAGGNRVDEHGGQSV